MLIKSLNSEVLVIITIVMVIFAGTFSQPQHDNSIPPAVEATGVLG